MKSHEGKERIILSLDLPTLDRAMGYVHQLVPYVGYFRVGLELLVNDGAPQVVSEIVRAGGRVLLDGKFNDTPDAIANATKSLAAQECSMFTMHISSGIASIRAAVANRGASKVVGIAVLDSMTPKDTERVFWSTTAQKTVEFAEEFARDGGDAILCQPQLIDHIRRSHEIAKENQLRASNRRDPLIYIAQDVQGMWGLQPGQMSPRMALHAGADYLVIGHPILQPPTSIGDPITAAKSIAAEIESTLHEHAA